MLAKRVMSENLPSVAKANSATSSDDVRAEARTLQGWHSVFLELWSTGFAVISVHQRGMEIAQIRPSLILFRQ
jgi:hypothetical protein